MPSATRLHNGAWQISDIIDNHLVTRTYYDYTERQALSAFRDETDPFVYVVHPYRAERQWVCSDCVKKPPYSNDTNTGPCRYSVCFMQGERFPSTCHGCKKPWR